MRIILLMTVGWLFLVGCGVKSPPLPPLVQPDERELNQKARHLRKQEKEDQNNEKKKESISRETSSDE